MDYRDYVQRTQVRADAGKLFSETNFMENQIRQHRRSVTVLPWAQAASILLAAPTVVWVMLIFLPNFPYANYALLIPAGALLWAFERMLKEPKIGEFVKDHIRWGFRGEARLRHLNLKPVRINLGITACACIIFSILASCTGAMLFTYQQSDRSAQIAQYYADQRADTEGKLTVDTAAINRAYAAKIAAVTAEEEAYRKRVSYKGRIDMSNKTNVKRFADYTQQKSDLRKERLKELESRTIKLSPTLTDLDTAEANELSNNTDYTRRNVLIMLVLSLLVEGTIISCLYNKYDCLAYIWLDQNLSNDSVLNIDQTSRQAIPTANNTLSNSLSDKTLALNKSVADKPLTAVIPVPTDRNIDNTTPVALSVSELPDVSVEEQPEPDIDNLDNYIDTMKQNWKRAHEMDKSIEVRAARKKRAELRMLKLRSLGYTVQPRTDKPYLLKIDK